MRNEQEALLTAQQRLKGILFSEVPATSGHLLYRLSERLWYPRSGRPDTLHAWPVKQLPPNRAPSFSAAVGMSFKHIRFALSLMKAEFGAPGCVEIPFLDQMPRSGPKNLLGLVARSERGLLGGAAKASTKADA